MKPFVLSISLAAVLIACGNDRQTAKSPSANNELASSEPSSRSAGMEAMFELASRECAELVGHLLTLVEKAGEEVDASWEEAVRIQLSVCMAADYSAKETQCLKSAASPEEYEGCTTARKEAAHAEEREARNPQSIHWEEHIDSGLALASAQSKLVVLHFVADWCAPCVQFEKQVLGNAKVAELLKERFVAVRLDVTNYTPSNEALQSRFKARTLPVLLVLSATGKELARMQSGHMPGVEEFLARISAIK